MSGPVGDETRPAALVLTDGYPRGAGSTFSVTGDTKVAGLAIAERAMLALRGAGVTRVHLVGEHLPAPRILSRVAQRGCRLPAR